MRNRLARLLTGTVLATLAHCSWGAQAAAPADDIVRFPITRFNISGNTLLPQTLIDTTLAPFLGNNRDFGDVQRALEALENVYHARGYNVVTIELPEQELNQGEVQFKVVQTKIGRVKVTGNTVFDEANIRRSLPGLREGQTPNLKEISASMKLANENPAKKITMKLASGEADDEVDVNLAVVDERIWKASANFDNTGTDSTGKTHAGIVLQNANLWGLDHLASLQYTTTVEKPSQVAVYGAGYHIPLYALGDSLDFFGSYSNVDSGTVAAGIYNLAVSGKGTVLGGRYTHALAKTDSYEPKLVYGIDYKAFKNVVLLVDQNFGNDITVHPLSLAYTGSWTLDDGQADLSLTALRNIPGGKLGGAADFNRTRLNAQANYTIFRVAATYAHSFKSDWQLRAIANGQYTRDSLIPGEQFGAGGSTSVRGFTEREVSNDSGVVANFELYTPNYCATMPNWQCRFLAFYDAAYANRNDALPGELLHTAIASTGLGMRMSMAANLNAQLDYGHVLDAGATASQGKNRLHVRVGFSY